MKSPVLGFLLLLLLLPWQLPNELSVTPKYGKMLRRYLAQSPVSTHNFNFESRFWAVNCSSLPPPLASWSCWEVEAILDAELRSILKSDPAWKKCCDFPGIHIVGFKRWWGEGGVEGSGRGRRGTNWSSWIKNIPWSPTTMSDIPCSYKVLPDVPPK